MINKSGQGWGFDLVVACSIFFIALIAFYFFAVNNSSQGQDNLALLSYESQLIADSLLSEGYPLNWSISEVDEIGIVSNNKINQTKLEMFYNLSETNYSFTKIIFGITGDYFVNFSEPIYIQDRLILGIGFPPENHENLIKSSRYIIYNNRPVTLTVEVWK